MANKQNWNTASRNRNKEAGGENLSGTLDPESTASLRFLIQEEESTGKEVSKIAIVRKAICEAARRRGFTFRPKD